MDGTVLIADDDRTIRTVLSQAMARAGMQVHATSSLTTLMRWVAEGKGDLVITDVAMPDGNGIEMIPRIAELRPGLPVIVISAQNTIMTAIRANEAAAWDYLPKPFDLPDLMHRSAMALKETPGQAKAPQGVKTPVPTAKATDGAHQVALSGRSVEMQSVFQTIARITNTDIPVLVSGASGSGKSRVARAIHSLGERSERAVIVLDPTLPGIRADEDALLTALSGGTLILDEPADYTADEQLKLNRFLDRLNSISDGVAPRLIATSQHDLSQYLTVGEFRQDLYYRLKGVEIQVPALQDRPGDIVVLAEEFLQANDLDDQGPGVGRSNGIARALSPEAEVALKNHRWPGNIRELKNTIRQIVAIGSNTVISGDDVKLALQQDIDSHGGSSFPSHRLETLIGGVLPGDPRHGTSGGAGPAIDPHSDNLGESVARHLRRYFDLHQDTLPPPGLYQRILRELEIPLFEISLENTHGNQAKCAELLGINRNTLRKKLTDLDIRVTRGRKLM